MRTVTQAEATPKVKAAASEAAKAFDALSHQGEAVEIDQTGTTAAQTVMKVRKNFFYVYVQFKDGTGTMSPGLRGAGEINAWLKELGTQEVEETTVLFGHERKAKRQTRLVFS